MNANQNHHVLKVVIDKHVFPLCNKKSNHGVFLITADLSESDPKLGVVSNPNESISDFNTVPHF